MTLDSYPMVDPQYIGHNIADTKEGSADQAKIPWLKISRAAVKRKLGTEVPNSTLVVAEKRRRLKSYSKVMQLENMLKPFQRSLSDYTIPMEDGKPLSLFHWPSLSLCPDRGPDMICSSSFLQYGAKLNVSFDFDPSHDSKNVAKNALKQSGHYSFVVLVTAGMNCVYGSTLSPPRLQQIVETCQEYFEQATPNDWWFQLWLLFLATSLKLDIGLTDVGAEQAECRGRGEEEF